ncbi:MAG: hypothetical protein M3T56_06965 [Chloroflexota bacterium]|nr:hypothetical protein [Chloroflexota bacterium]
MATTPAPDKHDAYAVVRLDSFRNFTPRPENVTVRRVVHHFAEAELEVRHLNMTAPTGTVYFIQRTTVARRLEPVVVPLSPAAATPELLSPRSRRARAEKKTGKKKGRRK